MQNPDLSEFKPEILTLDGPSAVGKGTLCRLVAEVISQSVGLENVRILDAGHTYRMLAYYFMMINHKTPEELIDMGTTLPSFLEANISITFDGITYNLNGNNAQNLMLKTPEIDKVVARYSGIDDVKLHVVEAQKGFLRDAPNLWWILDGRCMGTAVAPDALIKVYVDADPKIKAGWRHAQYIHSGLSISAEDVYEELVRRDIQDRDTRKYPLARPDACFFIWSNKGTAKGNANLILDYIASQLLLKGTRINRLEN